MIITLERFLRTLKRLKFELLLREPFEGKFWDKNTWSVTEDFYYIYWLEPVLVTFDSYFGDKIVNGGFVWYNWIPKDKNCQKESGYWKDDVWIGHHDCRVNFTQKLKTLRKEGHLVCPWIVNNLILINYMEKKDKTAPRVALLPEHVKKLIVV